MSFKNKKTVYVGLSGGVDSSVSALLLKESGFDVVGVFIETWQPDFLECSSTEDRLDAMKVCAVLNIPFKTFDAKDQYRDRVAKYMIEEYRVGRTPNPDVMCNKYVKFGLFFDWAISNGADFIATGHYCQIKKQKNQDNTEEFHLLKGNDSNKDQSYFLWAVPEKVFSKVIFPVGDKTKEQVRKIAQSKKLPTAQKKDSQGICFLGKVDIKSFLSHYIKPQKGDVIDKKGQVIGYHDGAFFYTVGQRHGFTIEKKTPESKPFYVTEKDVTNNILKVSQAPQKENKAKKISLINENWISKKSLNEFEEKAVTCLTRYRQKEITCQVNFKKTGTSVIFKKPQQVAEGQSLVIYKEKRCLGGGIIDKINYYEF